MVQMTVIAGCQNLGGVSRREGAGRNSWQMLETAAGQLWLSWQATARQAPQTNLIVKLNILFLLCFRFGTNV